MSVTFLSFVCSSPVMQRDVLKTFSDEKHGSAIEMIRRLRDVLDYVGTHLVLEDFFPERLAVIQSLQYRITITRIPEVH